MISESDLVDPVDTFPTDFYAGVLIERRRVLAIIATAMLGSSPERRQLAHDLIRQIEGPA
jgi:hypothetical protein